MTLVIRFERHAQRRDTEANWISANPILAGGEHGVVTDSGNPQPFKIGDGATAWNSLPYVNPIGGAGSGTNTITATLDPKPVLFDGMIVYLRAAAANTGAATFNPNSLGALAVTKHGGTALAAGDIAAAGDELILRYRSSVPRWELLNPAISGQAPIQFKDEGVNVGSSGAITSVDVTGAGATASVAGSALTINIPGGGSLSYASLPLPATQLAVRGGWAFYFPSVNSTAATVIGWAGSISTQLGTGAAVNIANTDHFTRQSRFRATSSAVAGNFAGVYFTTALFCGNGGWFFGWRGGSSDPAAVANARCFYGVRAAIAAPLNANPSTGTDILGFGADSGDTQLTFMHNDAAGTATKVTLNGGVGFPAHTLSADFYEIQIMQLPGASLVAYYIRNIGTGLVASGTVNTDLPALSTMMAPGYFRNNGATALAVRLENGAFMWAFTLEG